MPTPNFLPPDLAPLAVKETPLGWRSITSTVSNAAEIASVASSLAGRGFGQSPGRDGVAFKILVIGGGVQFLRRTADVKRD